MENTMMDMREASRFVDELPDGLEGTT